MPFVGRDDRTVGSITNDLLSALLDNSRPDRVFIRFLVALQGREVACLGKVYLGLGCISVHGQGGLFRLRNCLLVPMIFVWHDIHSLMS